MHMRAHFGRSAEGLCGSVSEGFSAKGRGGLTKGFPSVDMAFVDGMEGELSEERSVAQRLGSRRCSEPDSGGAGSGRRGPIPGHGKEHGTERFARDGSPFWSGFFSERKEGCRFVLHRVRRRGEEGNVRMEGSEALFSLLSDGKGHSPEFFPRSEGIWNIGRESSSACFQRGLYFGFRIRVRIKKAGPLGGVCDQ